MALVVAPGRQILYNHKGVGTRLCEGDVLPADIAGDSLFVDEGFAVEQGAKATKPKPKKAAAEKPLPPPNTPATEVEPAPAPAPEPAAAPKAKAAKPKAKKPAAKPAKK